MGTPSTRRRAPRRRRASLGWGRSQAPACGPTGETDDEHLSDFVDALQKKQLGRVAGSRLGFMSTRR